MEFESTTLRDLVRMLYDRVMSFAVSRYLTLWLRNAVRVKDPHFTLAHHRVSIQ